MSDYRAALEAAGAAVLVYETFGSYQGDWLALCFYKGDFRWVHGSYGSCSGCDAFEAEFGWGEDRDCPEYKLRLANFGEQYLDDVVDDAQIGRWKEQAEWDSETASMLEFMARYPLDEEGKNELAKQQLMRKGD